MDDKTRLVEPRPLTHADTRLVIAGTLLPVFIGSLDSTILASALPIIGREFADVHSLPWLITAYLIASTAVVPLFGKISDISGRRFTMFIAISLHMAGSLMCALAPNMLTLIFGRLLQGFGGGGLTSMGMVILGDIAAPKDRGRYYAYFSATYTTAGACGPLLGGFLAEHVHWSAIFWLPIPLGLIAVALTFTLLRRLPRHDRPHKLDFLGALLIMAASSTFMLALNAGGVRYPWASLPVLALVAVAAVIGLAFVWRLRTAPEPLIPLSILRDPVARCAFLINGCGWGSIIGLNIFLPTYLQSVVGMSATTSGLSLMVVMFALNFSAGTTGQILGRVRRYKIVPMIGIVISISAVLTLAWFAGEITPFWFEVVIALMALGFGPIPPLTAVVLQNTVARISLASPSAR